MTSFNNSQRSRHTYGLLANVTVTELESIRVGIKRRNVTSTHPPSPIERNLDDPKSIIPLVHSRKDKIPRTRSIFDREGVLVNKDDGQVQVNNPSRSESCSRSNSRSSARTYSGRRSRSSSRGRNRRRSTDRNVDRRRSSDRGTSDRRSRDISIYKSTERRRSPDVDRGTSRRYERRSEDRRRSIDREYERRRSIDREYERRRSTERDRDKDRRRSKERERTPKRSGEKSSYYARRSYSREKYQERRKSITPLRPGEYRPNHPDLKKRSRSRGRDRYDKSSLRRSKSLSGDRQLPSTSKQRTPSPGRRRSTSPQRLPKRRRTSKSPDRYERKKSRSVSPRHSWRSIRQKSKSPRPSGVSSSPIGSRERKRYSRSPEYVRDRRYRYDRDRRRRSRSISPRHKEMVPFRDPNIDYGYYEGIPGQEFWMHPGLIRPGYPVPRFYPPAFYSRGMSHAGPVMFSPRYPFVPPITRPKLPVYNNRAKPNVTHVSDVDSSTIVGSSTVQTNSGGGCTIEEVKSVEVAEECQEAKTDMKNSDVEKNE